MINKRKVKEFALEMAKREATYMLEERSKTRETDRLVQYVRSQPRFGLARVGRTF